MDYKREAEEDVTGEMGRGVSDFPTMFFKEHWIWTSTSALWTALFTVLDGLP